MKRDIGKIKKIIECDRKYFRPLDVENLIGDASKAKKTFEMETKN